MSQRGLRIGRLFGINIFVDWSWIFIFLLVTWNLAGSAFPSLHPEWSTALRWGTAILAAILFFASVLAHELAHSIVAKANGLPVNRITLFLFGGVASIEREPTSPKTEFLMAIVGPLTSLVLGLLFLALGGASAFLSTGFAGAPMSLLSRLDPVTTLLLWLGPINIVLGVFNMVPGFPLDGGRVLRSILWAGTGSLRSATRWASWVGRGIAWLFIGLGILMIFGVDVPFFGSGMVGGLWLAFIGWFLNNAASQSYRQVVLEDVLQGITVSTLMRPAALSVAPDMPLSTLVYDYIMATDERAFPVVEGEKLVGLVSLVDVRQVPRDRWDTTTVREVMTPEEKLAVTNPREEASKVMNDIAARDVRQMPVVQEGRLVGMLRRADLMRYLQLHTELAK